MASRLTAPLAPDARGHGAAGGGSSEEDHGAVDGEGEEGHQDLIICFCFPPLCVFSKGTAMVFKHVIQRGQWPPCNKSCNMERARRSNKVCSGA